MDCYRVLRTGGSLQDNVLGAQELQAHQIAALGFQLCKKEKLNELERMLLLRTAQDAPEAAAYLVHLFAGTMASDILRTAVGARAVSERSLDLLKGTSRRKNQGKARLQALISDFLSHRISSVFMAIWLMKVCYDGMSDPDVLDLTLAMRDSGRIYDYRNLAELDKRRVIRRYPTGALSEKTALILPSLLSAFWAEFPLVTPFLVARSLGFTGGTWDKLSSIPGFVFPIQGEETIEVMKSCGAAMCVTSGDFNPADRELYKLRSVTGTVECEELIISSIASKQLAVPADHLLLDVRYGPGAFLSESQAGSVASHLQKVIVMNGVPCILAFNDTQQPTGTAVGNALEVLESLAVMGFDTSAKWDERALQEQRQIVIGLFSDLMSAEFKVHDKSWWQQAAEDKLGTQEVRRAFLNLLLHHKVPKETVDQIATNPAAIFLRHIAVPVYSRLRGRLSGIDQPKLGNLVNFSLGAGGNDYAGQFDCSTGVILRKRLGDRVDRNEAICDLYAGEQGLSDTPSIVEDILSCFTISDHS